MDSSEFQMREQYRAIRAHTIALTSSLSAEDQCVQSMPEASPTKWHLAHTTWFFETMVLRKHLSGYQLFNPGYHFLFNSYYEALGPRQPRPQRGMITRPSLDDVLAYRKHVDDAVCAFIDGLDKERLEAVSPVITLGLHHEQQHQELIVTDIIHLFSLNPTLPAYAPQEGVLPAWHGVVKRLDATVPEEASRWLAHPGGKAEIGHEGAGFAFDNESPRHTAWLQPFEISEKLVTVAEYLGFMRDGGYREPSLWLSDGWAAVQQHGWEAPMYWMRGRDPRIGRKLSDPGEWFAFGRYGVRQLSPDAPVSGLSFYEACAYAMWAGARLPTEFEWESACVAGGMSQVYGHVWQWTRSAYEPYPGYRTLEGPASEYNGKFMVGLQVLRGGSFATPAGHSRPTYRNFFHPASRWQITGLRLARDA